jgi:two-component system capsular synthesis response regulator RcsB
MFHKIITAEDYQSTHLSIQKALSDLQIHQTQYASYCDEAYKKIHQAIMANQPYEVLITDLSFDEDHVEQSLKSGFELIKAVKRLRSETKIIVFSAEKKEGVHDILKMIARTNTELIKNKVKFEG